MAGLGDLVYYILKFTGIQWLHKFIRYTILRSETPCRCEARRRLLNRKVPFRRTHGN